MRPSPPLPISLAAAAVLLLSACASTDERVPDDSSEAPPDYQSTRDDSSSSGPSSNSESRAEGAEQNAQRRALRKGSSRGGGSGEPPRAVGPVAHVDGEPIAADAFNEEIQKVAETGKFPPSVLHKFKTRLIDRLVDQHLVDRMLRQTDIEVTKREIDEQLEQVRARFDRAARQGGNEQSLEQIAKRHGISDDDLRDSIRRSIAIEKFFVERGLDLPTESEAQNFYEKNEKKFTRPEQVRTRHILAQVSPDAAESKWNEAKSRIEKIRKKVVSDGAKFAEMARKKSDGPSAKNGGDIGFISRNQFDASYTKVAFKQKKGEVSPPVKTKYGWHLIKTVDKRESKTLPFEQIEERLTQQLKNRRIQKRLQKHLDELRSDADIEKHLDNIE